MNQPSPQQDLVASLHWIDILHGDSPGLVHICAFGDWEGQSFDWATERDAAARYIEAKDPAQGIYLRVSTLLHALEPGKRGSDTDSATLPGLWADIDLAGPGHKTTNTLPRHFEDAAQILEQAGLPEPTVWIHSGGGLYPMWLLDQTHRIANREDFEQLRVLSAKWQEVIAAAASTLGFHYGTGVGDLSRVLRLPGTINRKEGLARPCKVLEDTWGRSYSLDDLKQALLAAVERLPERVVAQPALRPPTRDGLSPGDDYENRTSWAEILEPAGWTFHHRQGTTDYWTRPGKSRRDGHSASSGHSGDRDRLFVFTTETEFPAWQPLTKFHVYTLLHHNGDHSAAARELARRDYGEQRTRPSNVDRYIEASSPVTGETPRPERLLRLTEGREDHTLSGAAARFVRENGHLISYVIEEKSWRIWDGIKWDRDELGAQVSEAFEAMTEDMLDEAEILEHRAETEPDAAPLAKSARKWVTSCRNSNRNTIMSMIANKTAVSADRFDANPRYLNLQNGVYDMVADQFLPHDRKYMLTKVAAITYDKDIKAPKSEAFLSELLPSEQMREFTLQSLAYSLTGEADRKAMFILQGIPNSGKTQITELAANLFGDYAVSVSPGTFTKKREHGPNPELHNMRGARFVYTSETSYEIQLDEELVKRITGKDTMSTRTLYEKPQQWLPQCAVWIATNNLPRFGSDSDAMWRRVKTIRFVNEFTDDGSSGHQAQPNIGRHLAAEEASGLFNLLLAALRRYRAAGRLDEPQELKDSVAAHREETDPLVQWLTAVQEMQQLVADETAEANQGAMRKAYFNWCEERGYTALGAQRFGNAVTSLLRCSKRRSNGETLIAGWKFQAPLVSWLIGRPPGVQNE